MNPTLENITRQNGIAGQLAYGVTVTYPDESPERIVFVGSVYGGPVVMQTAGNPAGVFVTDPSRFGKFSPDWIRAFFA